MQSQIFIFNTVNTLFCRGSALFTFFIIYSDQMCKGKARLRQEAYRP